MLIPLVKNMTTDNQLASRSIADFQKQYGVSHATVYRWARQGLLRLTRIGPRTTRIMREDEEKWLANRKAA